MVRLAISARPSRRMKVHIVAAHHGADSAVEHAADGALEAAGTIKCDVRIFSIKQIILGVLESILHREFEFDDILVLRQHGSPLLHAPVAGHVDHFDTFDRIRDVPSRSRHSGTVVLAKAEHNASLAGLDDIEAGQQPQDQQDEQNAASANRPPAAAPAASAPTARAEQTPEQVSKQVIQVRRPLSRIALPRVSTVVVPSHESSE